MIRALNSSQLNAAILGGEEVVAVSDRSYYPDLKIQSLELVHIERGAVLHDLQNIKSLSGVRIEPGCSLHGLPDDVDISCIKATTELERSILERIPLDRLDMENYHCGTSHCLAGWAQCLEGDIEENSFHEGVRLMPNISPIFFAPTVAVKKWLVEKQYLP